MDKNQTFIKIKQKQPRLTIIIQNIIIFQAIIKSIHQNLFQPNINYFFNQNINVTL